MELVKKFLAMPRWGQAGVVGVALVFAVAVFGGGDGSDGPQIVRTDVEHGFAPNLSLPDDTQGDPEPSEASQPDADTPAGSDDVSTSTPVPSPTTAVEPTSTPAPTPTVTAVPPTAVPPTATAVPPTPAPPTAVPPTPVPPTAVPPTPVPPTAVPPTPVPPTAVPQPTATVPPTAVPPPAPPPPQPNANAGSCTPGYSPCIPPGDDVDCAGGSGNGPRYVAGPIRVTGSDPYRLDGDNDGIGCE